MTWGKMKGEISARQLLHIHVQAMQIQWTYNNVPTCAWPHKKQWGMCPQVAMLEDLATAIKV